MNSDIRFQTAQLFESLAQDLIDSTVIIDRPMQETLRWSIGLAHFLQLNVANIHDFEDTAKATNIASDMPPTGNERPPRVIFFITSPLPDVRRRIENCIKATNAHQYQIYSALSESAISSSTGRSFKYTEMEESLSIFIQRMNDSSSDGSNSTYTEDSAEPEKRTSREAPELIHSPRVERVSSRRDGSKSPRIIQTESQDTESFPRELYVKISHFPASVAPITPRLFIVPSASDCFPVLFESSSPGTDQTLSFTVKKEVLNTKLTQSLPETFKHMAGNLMSFFQQMEWKPEIFSIGSTSNLVAQFMESIEKPTNTIGNASLILIDRTLDMVSPCHTTDSLGDRIYSLLNSKVYDPFSDGEHHRLVTDVAFTPITAIAESISGQEQTYTFETKPLDYLQYSIHSSLAHPHCQKSCNLVEKLIINNAKTATADSKITLCQAMIEAQMLQEKDLSRAASLPTTQLRNILVRALKSPSFITKNGSLMQVLLATLSVIDGSQRVLELVSQDHMNRRNYDHAIEKTILASMSDQSTPLLQEIIRSYMIPNPDEPEPDPNVQVPRIIDLATMIYSLLGNSLQDEDEMDFGIKLLHYSASHTTKLFGPSVEKSNRTEYRKREEQIRNTIKTLRAFKHARDNLVTFGSLVRSESPYNSFVSQLSRSVISGEGDVNELEQFSSSIGGVIRSGLSYFKLVSSKPRPNPSNPIVFFIVGGITCAEVREITEISAQFNKSKVYIGSTRFIQQGKLHEIIGKIKTIPL